VADDAGQASAKRSIPAEHENDEQTIQPALDIELHVSTRFRFACSNGGRGSLLRTGGAFLWRHGFKRTLPADLSANFPTLCTLLAEKLQNFGRSGVPGRAPVN